MEEKMVPALSPRWSLESQILGARVCSWQEEPVGDSYQRCDSPRQEGGGTSLGLPYPLGKSRFNLMDFYHLELIPDVSYGGYLAPQRCIFIRNHLFRVLH